MRTWSGLGTSVTFGFESFLLDCFLRAILLPILEILCSSLIATQKWWVRLTRENKWDLFGPFSSLNIIHFYFILKYLTTVKLYTKCLSFKSYLTHCWCSRSHVQLFVTPRAAENKASLSFTISWSLMPTDTMTPRNHLTLCRPLLFLSSIFPSIRVFSNKSALHIQWQKYWGFSFHISSCLEYSGLISFRIDWFDLLAVQGTLKSLLQHHSLKASTLQCSAFFTVQLSHPYMTAGKPIALTRQTFVGKAMSLLFNMLSRLVIAFLPRSKCLLISWL